MIDYLATWFPWLGSLLDRWQLPEPDGRPLFRYRCTDKEWAALPEALEHVIARSTPGTPFDDHTGALWCMLVAEWWRRHYDGGPWSWKGVRAVLGPQANALPDDL